MLKLIRRGEPLLLFLLLFFPGYLMQSPGAVDPVLFNSFSFNILYILTAGPQLILVLYLMMRTPDISGKKFGLVRFKRIYPLKAMVGTARILLVLIPLYIIYAILVSRGIIPELPGMTWSFTNKTMIPVVFVTCLVTGYLEESFFRSYLITWGEKRGIGKTGLVAGINVLFAAGHVYQGPLGFLATFLIGILLSFQFLRHRNLHLIAWSHGYYNFIVLMGTLILS
jgi:hypothetical protein